MPTCPHAARTLPKLMKDGKFSMSGQAGAKEADEKDKEEMLEDAAVFPEAYMLNQKGYEYSLKGIEQVEGKDAYVVAVKTPSKRDFTTYYDVASGLPVKRTSTQAGPQGSMTVSTVIGNYKNFNGVQIPTKMIVDQGPMKIEINFTDVKVNSGLKPEDIK